MLPEFHEAVELKPQRSKKLPEMKTLEDTYQLQEHTNIENQDATFNEIVNDLYQNPDYLVTIYSNDMINL